MKSKIYNTIFDITLLLLIVIALLGLSMVIYCFYKEYIK